MEVHRELIPRVEALYGGRIVATRPVSGGYTPAARMVAELTGGERIFVKAGTDAATSRCLRAEQVIYEHVQGPFLPQLLAFEDHPEQPLLLIEDLSDGHWPPPWNRDRIDAVLGTLEAVHSARPAVPSYRDAHGSREPGWQSVASDPAPFLSLGLASKPWLEAVLPTLVAAEDSVETEGEALTHWDVRSDNLCITGRGAVLVDWNGGCLSNPRLDLGFWLPSLCDEGGPEPEAILRDAPDVASWVSGFFAARAGLPAIPKAPGVRPVQRAQLIPALAWTVRALGLPPPT